MLRFRKYHKRLLSALLIIGLVLSGAGFCTLAGAVSGATLAIDSKANIAPGSSVVVSISVSENINAAAFEFWVSYDASKLELTGASAGSALTGISGGQSYISDSIAGTVFMQWDSTTSSLNTAGSILDLTFTVKLDATGNAEIKIDTSEDVVFYTPDYDEIGITISQGKISISPASFISVDVLWGNMSFTYREGTWNPNTHEYEGSGWVVNSNGENAITCTNSGTAAVSASLTYTTKRPEISGSFSDNVSSVLSPLLLSAGETKTCYLTLSGKPSDALSNTEIGTVTVTIKEIEE